MRPLATADREIQSNPDTKASLAPGMLQYPHILWRNMKLFLFLLCASLSSAALVRREAEAEAEPAYGFDVNGGEIWQKKLFDALNFFFDQIMLSLCAPSPQ